jgi:hypothetical protein
VNGFIPFRLAESKSGILFANLNIPFVTADAKAVDTFVRVHPETVFLDVILRSPADGGRRRIS